MLKFKSVHLDHIVYYKKAFLDLDYKGTTIILGKNLNSTAKGRRNGAGKSLLVSTIPHIRYGEPTGHNKAKHSLLSNSNSAIRWVFEQKGIEWDITKARKGKSVKWSIMREGQDQEPRTATIAESIIKEIIPLNDEEFYTTVYLDSRRMNILTSGTAAQRHKYFTDLFRLYDFDSLKNYFSNKLKDLDKYSAKKDAYDDILEELGWVKSFNADEVQREIDANKQRIQSLDFKIQKANRELHIRTLYDKHHDKLLDSKKFDADEFKRLSDLKDAWNRYIAYTSVKRQYEDDYAEYESNVAKAKSLIGFKKFIKSEVDSYILDGAKKDERYERDIRKYTSNKKKQAEAKKSIAKYEEERHVLDVKIDLPKLIADVKILSQKLRDYSSQDGNSVCDYCGSTLSKKKHSNHIKSIERKLRKAKEAKREGESIKQKQAKVKRMRSREDELLAKRKLIRPKKPSSDYKHLMGLNFSKPKKPPIIKKPSESLKSVTYKHKAQEKFKLAYDVVSSLSDEIDAGTNLKKSSVIKTRLKNLNRKKDMLIKCVAEKESSVKEFKRQRKTFDDYISKVKNLDRRLSDKTIFEALVKAYGAKGIKLMVMNNIVKMIARNMNRFSPLLFLEPFSFEASVDENLFDIIVTRKDGTASDIRSMSGAETRLFSLLWLISVLPLIPDNRRMNIVVLDEFEAGMDEVTRQLILDKFLFNLNTIVPHIIFISPFSIQEAPGRRVLTAVKRGKLAKLK